MNYRKLISFGKGGFVISVPKSWITENKLEKGSILTVEQKENSIVLSAQDTQVKSQATQASIVVDGLSPCAVVAKMTKAYLDSTTIISLSGKELPQMLAELKSHVHNSIALEIIDSEKNKLVVKDYLNFSDVSISSVFRKMDMVVRSLFTDLKTDNPNIAMRLNEIDRHFLLLLKAINKASSDHSLLKTFGVTSPELFSYLDHGLALKRIGEGLARFVEVRKKHKSNDLDNVLSLTENFYLSMVKSLVKNERPPHLYTQQKEIYKAVDEFQSLSTNEGPILAEILRSITSICESLVGRIG